MKVTYLGTTVLLFDDGVDQVLFDAHLTRPSLIAYLTNAATSTNTQIADKIMRMHAMDRVRAIFVSHAHHDHVMDAPYIANRCGATIYGSSSVLNVGRGGGVGEDRLVEFKGGETFEVGGFKVTVIPSIHSKPTMFNNDLGQNIEQPLVQPAKLRSYKEGGSYDFYVEAKGKKILIRPSYNYLEGQLNGIHADVLFLGIAGMAKASEEFNAAFFYETVEKVSPSLVIPLHWDNFFSSLDKPIKGMPRVMEKSELAFFKLGQYCEAHDINCLIQIPRTSIVL